MNTAYFQLKQFNLTEMNKIKAYSNIQVTENGVF